MAAWEAAMRARAAVAKGRAGEGSARSAGATVAAGLATAAALEVR